MRTWVTEVVMDAYRAEGVPWSDEELRQRAEAVAREIRRMNTHDYYARRKVRRHEISFGLCQHDDMGTLKAYRERQRLNAGDWGEGPGDRRPRDEKMPPPP